MTLSERAITRRAKKYLRQNYLDLYLSVLPGLEGPALDEVRTIDQRASATHGGVRFGGDLASIYKCNLTSRVGNRVLLRVSDFLAQSYPMLHDRTKRLPWEVFLGSCQEIQVRVSFTRSRLRNKAHIRSVVLKAIADRQESLGIHTSGRTHHQQIAIYVRLDKDRCTISLDTTGTHLHKRGYRKLAGQAPIRESIASGILSLARATTYDVVVDPFCGSGTFCIESDLASRRIPPGLRRSFAIELTPLHSTGLLAHVRREVVSNVIHPSRPRIIGLDVDSDVVDAAVANAKRAETESVEFGCADATSLNFAELRQPREKGLIVANMPYGKRLGTAYSTDALREAFERQLLNTASGWDFAIATRSALEVRNPRMRVSQTISLDNGGVRITVSFGTVLD